MGLGGISIWQLLIILVIVILLFGTKRLGSLGADLGSAIRGFRKSMQEDDSNEGDPRLTQDNGRQNETETIDAANAEKERPKD